ncbi:MAG: methyltransferase domain-containing protein [bacterium]|nr:methyltransferase domain-containing protein [bacterium]
MEPSEDTLRTRVKEAYSAAAVCPTDQRPFPVGRDFALNAGYPEHLLAELPLDSVDAFCGASNVSIFAKIPAGSTVLDLGCGAGLDTLIAARNTGPTGKVIAIDFSESMLTRARAAATEHRATNIEFRQGDAEQIPTEDATIDVAIINGIFNLNPARDLIFGELARVIRPGGQAFAAEIILRGAPGPLKRLLRAAATSKDNPDNWFA